MLKVVRASTRDAKTLAQLSKQAFDNDVHYGAPGPGGPPGYDSAAWQSQMMKIGEYYKVVQDGQTIGGIIVFRKGVRAYEVGRIFITPPCQNQGIGKQVFEFLWTAYPLVKRWTLGTPKWNTRTRHFYARVGFEEIGEDGRGGVFFERCAAPFSLTARWVRKASTSGAPISLGWRVTLAGLNPGLWKRIKRRIQSK